MQSTKERLVALIADDDARAIALTGRWGTGKSFMWDEIHKSPLSGTRVQKAVYVSLFGQTSVDQVKLKLMQSALPMLDSDSVLVQSGKRAVATGVKVLEAFHKAFGAINDFGLLAAPSMLKGKLVVLDDIERKHDKLDIEEVLGFIDEFTQRFDVKFLLILNSDRLKKKDLWDTMREKVIDQEVQLTTTPDEAFDIALSRTPSKWSEPIKKAISKCSITNIRIISKVINAMNKVLGAREAVSDVVLARVVPSTVLLALIHYRGIDDGPDAAYVLSFGSKENWEHYFRKDGDKGEVHAKTEEERNESRWHAIVTGVGIYACDQFERHVHDYLQAGLYGPSPVSETIDGFEREGEMLLARAAVNAFWVTSFWEHKLSDQELLGMARQLVDTVHLLDPYTATYLHHTLLDIDGGSQLAEEVITRWCASPKNVAEPDAYAVLRRRIHPRIQEAIDQAQAAVQAKITVLDACRELAPRKGWGSRQELALRAATVDDFESSIRNGNQEELTALFAVMLDFVANERTYTPNFGNAMSAFVTASRRISTDLNVARLARLVRGLFKDAKLEHLLEQEQAASG